MHFRKLLNIEKRLKNELLIRKDFIAHQNPSKEHKKLLNNIKQIEEDNKKLEKNIDSLRNKVILEYENKSNKNPH